MRISTTQIYRQGLDAMLDQQLKLSRTQLQLSTGRRILTPSDDPAGAAQVLDLTQSLEATRQYLANGDAARARLSLEEGTLGGVGDLLQRVRELTVQANNDTQTNESRRAIAQELRGRLDELLGLANTRDANNEYLFAGHQGQAMPFVRTGAGFGYNGDDGSRLLQVGPSTRVAVSDSGREVFQAIRNGNGVFTTLDDPANTGSGVIDPGGVTDPAAWVPDDYTITFLTATSYEVRDGGGGLVTSGTYASGAAITFNGVTLSIGGAPAAGDEFSVTPSAYQDVFTTVQDLIDALETPAGNPAGRARFHNAMNRALTDLDQDLGHMLEVRSRLGTRLNAVDNQRDLNDAFALILETTRSGVEDLDYAEAVSRLNRQLLALEAAQQTYVKVQGLSLFNFLR